MPKSLTQKGMARGTKEGKREWPQEERFTTATGESGKESAQRQQQDSTIDDWKRRRARQRVQDAYAWIQTYPKAFQFVRDYLRNEYDHGRKLSMQMAWERLREKEWSGTKGETFALNNDLRPALSRILLLENPQYKGKLELRRSPLDALMDVRR